MMSFAGDAVTISIPLIVNGEYAVPDLNTVSYTVRDNSGSVVVPATAVTTDASTTTVHVQTSSSINQITKDVETRYVELKFSVSGNVHIKRVNYQIITWVPLTVSEDHVRAELGVTIYEVPDGDINIASAYFQIKHDLGTTFVDSLTAGNRLTFTANRLVALRAALNVIPSLQLRIMQSEKTDTAQMSRLSSLDFERLTGNLSSTYGQLQSEISGVGLTEVGIFNVVSGTDPFTGA